MLTALDQEKKQKLFSIKSNMYSRPVNYKIFQLASVTLKDLFQELKKSLLTSRLATMSKLSLMDLPLFQISKKLQVIA